MRAFCLFLLTFCYALDLFWKALDRVLAGLLRDSGESETHDTR